jgi:hypothetical protein
MLDGYQLREKREMERIAWLAANLMNVHLPKKKQVTIKKLLGQEKRMTQAERQAQLDKLSKLTKGGK